MTCGFVVLGVGLPAWPATTGLTGNDRDTPQIAGSYRTTYRTTSTPWQRHTAGIDADTVDTKGDIASALDLAEYKHVKDLKVATRGAFLLTFAGDATSTKYHDEKGVTDPKKLPNPALPRDIATLFSYALPLASAPAGRIAFTVRRKDRPDDAIVEAATSN